MGADTGPWGLGWLIDEVGATLEAAGDALENYLRDPSDRQQLHFCRAYLHQVAGSLEIADFQGGAQLLVEMTALVDALLRDEFSDRVAAGEALAAAAAAVPGYLGLTVAEHGDRPAALLSPLNDLRALQGRPLATESDMFNPDLTPFDQCSQSPPAAVDHVELAALCRKLRQIYQLGLLSLLKGEPLIDLPLRRMSKVAERMRELFAGHQRELLWHAGHAVLGGLSAEAPAGPALRQLLRELDRDLRACCDPAAFASSAPEVARSLVKNLLYYVATASAEQPGVSRLRSLFRLDQTLPGHSPARTRHSTAQHRDAALRDELEMGLRQLQDLSDQLVAAGVALEQAAAQLSPPLLHVRDTLVAAAHPAAARAAATYHELNDHPTQISWAQWADQISVLAALVCDEATSVMGSDGGQERRPVAWVEAAAAVVATVRGLLDEIKDAVVSYISARNNPLYLDGLPARAAQIARALEFIEQDRLSSVLTACGEQVARQLMRPGAIASWSQLDALADTLIACEYYLESLVQADTAACTRFLDQAEVKALELAAFEAASPPIETASSAAAKIVPLPAASRPVAPAADIPTSAADAVPTMIDTPASVVDADEEIRAIFIAEACEVLESIRDLEKRSPETSTEVLADLRRGFHTLKGSGRMVGAAAIAELSWAMENLLNKVRDGGVPWSAPVAQVVSDAISELPELIQAFAAGTARALGPTGTQLRETAEHLANGSPHADDPVAARAAMAPHPIQPLSAAFIEEAAAQLETVTAYVAAQRQTPASAPSAAVARALHMLVGCCERAGNPQLPRVIRALEALVNLCGELGQPPDTASLDLFEQALSAGRALITGTGSLTVDLARLGDQLDDLRTDLTRPAAHAGRERLRQLMTEGLVQLLSAPETFAASSGDRAESNRHFPELAAELEELAQTANTAELPALEELSSLLAAACRRLSGQPLTADTLATLRTSTDLLLGMLDALAANHPITAPTAPQCDALKVLGAANTTSQPAHAPAPESVAAPAGTDWAEHGASADRNRVDAELVGVFLEEAGDLGEQMEHALNEWRAGTDPLQNAGILKRTLHTLKGGARMAGCRTLGTLCHDFETLVLRAEATAEAGSDGFFAASLAHYDKIEIEIEHIRRLLREPEAAPRTIAAPPLLAQSIPPVDGQVVELPTAPSPAAFPQRHIPQRPGPPDIAPQRVRLSEAPRVQAPPWRVSTVGAKNRSDQELGGRFVEPREMVKIAAPILDNLVSLIDETSISRSRIEQHLHQFHALLEEMETTVSRFHDQVRRLSMETEAHTPLQREEPDAATSDDDFDPLEMDRYSQLQQLVRGLEESASDLEDLKDTLLDKVQDTESLLVQQARVNRDLHENLTLTRMVPFSRVVPRLRRIVRQTANELDKPIELHLDNVEGEMDRAVLERIVPSLEHLIRNAIDHGIESSEGRRLAGKPETGVVAITFAREAGDIVIRLSDDGRGLDVDAIRAKAASLQLLPSDADLSDPDIMQLIFRPGFSTSQAVSQISGRGLGMDVVDNEVRQLGGSVSLASRRNYGTEFTLRLPFTASVNRALLAKAGGELYGVLLNSVAGVVKLSAVELASLHADPEQRLHLKDAFYKVCPLASLIDGVLSPLPAAAGKLSVLLVRGKSDNVAVLVDALEPSQEIVVKSLGPQFAKVRGLAGATLLGDGRVVPIVDLVALITDYSGPWRMLPQPAIPGPDSLLASAMMDSAPSAATIVVVDDSVTMRKATSRLLERNGYRVLTARDGMEAMQLLQEVKPDLMLLDVEMPRMDGFEVARQVRGLEPLRDLPIAMITSRSGDKHRDRALELEINHYLGKPYQEEVLLSVVEELLAKSPGAP